MILIVSATKTEVLPLLKDGQQVIIGVPLLHDSIGKNEVEILVTGVGAVPTTFWLTNHLNRKKYDLVINVGVAGTFHSEIDIGEVVIVKEDFFADYGIDNQGKFISLFESGLCDLNQSPFNQGMMEWTYSERFHYLNRLPKVKGITIATASGSQQRINDLVKLYSPDIETMECAAVFYTCISSQTPFVCLRAISNRVEPRDTSKWNLSLAIDRLNEQTQSFLGSL